MIEFENKMKANITSALKEYVKHVSFLTHSNRRNLPWQDLYRMIHPRKSSPSLINEFLSIVGEKKDNFAFIKKSNFLSKILIYIQAIFFILLF